MVPIDIKSAMNDAKSNVLGQMTVWSEVVLAIILRQHNKWIHTIQVGYNSIVVVKILWLHTIALKSRIIFIQYYYPNHDIVSGSCSTFNVISLSIFSAAKIVFVHGESAIFQNMTKH